MIPIPIEIESEEQIIQLYQDALQENPNIRLAMIGEYIASMQFLFTCGGTVTCRLPNGNELFSTVK